MRVLLIGNRGREHALAWRLHACPSVSAIFCPFGNPGIAEIADCSSRGSGEASSWVEIAREVRADLVVVGPEAPLAEGIADLLGPTGVPVFGPTAAGARIESSKSFARELMKEAGIPHARGESFTEVADAVAFGEGLGFPVVVKADGLAGGKGVAICASREELVGAVEGCLVRGKFGAAGTRVVIEEFLRGEEVSVMALCDGEFIHPLPPVRDFKRLLDGDRGPMTGGMGAVAPSEALDSEAWSFCHGEILMPLLSGLQARGIGYRGVIYVGLIVTVDGPRVLEFNCRFGDPETQALMPLLEGDFAEALLACAEGRLESALGRGGCASLGYSGEHAVAKVLACASYPDGASISQEIRGIDSAVIGKGQAVFHANTQRMENGRLQAVSGRALTLVGWGQTRAMALAKVENLCGQIEFDGMLLRGDIGT